MRIAQYCRDHTAHMAQTKNYNLNVLKVPEKKKAEESAKAAAQAVSMMATQAVANVAQTAQHVKTTAKEMGSQFPAALAHNIQTSFGVPGFPIPVGAGRTPAGSPARMPVRIPIGKGG